MSQLSLFSAEARPAALTDLAGLLCGPGQIVRFGAGDQARLSIVLADAERAPAARVALAAAGARSASASTIDSRAWSPAPNRTICPGPHSRPARSVSAAGRASAENSDSCDTSRTLEHVFERAASARREERAGESCPRSAARYGPGSPAPA